MIRFTRYLASIDTIKEKENLAKNERNLSRLITQRFGNNASPDGKNIVNLSDYKLTSTEEFVLSHGLNFCLPPTTIKSEEVFAEFEVLMAQLYHRKANSADNLPALKARLSDLAHAYCGYPIDSANFLMTKECFRAIKALRQNPDIHISKPDKGSGVVILNKRDYILKMEAILGDESKFKTLGPAAEFDNIAKIERRIQRRLFSLKKNGSITPEVYASIRPVGAQRPRMYGLPKTHKTNVPVRPILSMIGSAQHKLAKWLIGILEPVRSMYDSHCVADSFTFAHEMKTTDLPNSNMFLGSYDIVSLFKNAPLTVAKQNTKAPARLRAAVPDR